jgi:hypothetical protein
VWNGVERGVVEHGEVRRSLSRERFDVHVNQNRQKKRKKNKKKEKNEYSRGPDMNRLTNFS